MKRRRWLTSCMLIAYPGWVVATQRTVLAAVAPTSPANGPSATTFLPLFPLRIVAFPGELVLLHIFEPRYVQLIRESVENGTSFGIVTVVSGGASSIGTEMYVERILRTHDSVTMDIAARGLRTFRLKSFQRDVKGKLYSGGQVSFDKNDPAYDPKVQSALVEFYNRLLSERGSSRRMAPPYPDNLSFDIGHDIGLSQPQKLQLLTMPLEHNRQKYLLQLLVESQ
ncbi:MAG TPA: LON peptidase substrate-binding domain-containing protein [Gammaproteobacteria bacterium]